MNAPMPIPTIWTTGSTAAIKTGTWRAALAQPCARALALPCRLPGPRRHRRMDRPGARARLPRRLADAVAPQPVARRHRPHLPPPLRKRLQPRRLRRAAVDLQARALRRRHRARTRLDPCRRRHAARRTHRRGRRRALGPVGGLPVAPARLCRHAVRGAARTRRPDALRHPRLPAGARGARRRDRAHRGAGHRRALRPVDGFATRRWPSCAPASTRSTWRYGARRQKRLPQLDYSRPWAVDGADYLARASGGAPPVLGARVVVVGGGSAALDVARSARRAGHEVTILALEAEADLPAQREEVVEAREEGIALADAAMLRGVRSSRPPACAWTACACASKPAAPRASSP